MKNVGQRILIAIVALILGIGQACACLSHADGSTSDNSAQSNADHSAHGGHHGVMNADHAKTQPGDEPCGHCVAVAAGAVQANLTTPVLTTPPATAILVSKVGPLVPHCYHILRHYRALNWLDPPADTPVSLKIVMRD
ncbi:hypothetical protein FF098_004670 [Parvularcula flava]|uniref:DUF2946 domain-containing protein n=1 Tax=Aquisalinus luteolus TaxID=1566827 RepID=A0A8J3A109_9PROT|nr:hypothetical protein [Aquisalinus luteolus]NHK27193.1 hypothetical protein [Aquisalinus luteolus]GGH94690.1 hypothetical protein GCM10011355_09470 [Aquisalinus luteolus]